MRKLKVLLVFLSMLTFVAPALADRNLPLGAAPASVLNAFFGDLQFSLNNPQNKDLGLTGTYANAQGYWVPSSRESVQRTGQVADLSSVMFFHMKLPVSWDIEEPRIAGDFARARVTFTPSASSGVARDSDYDLIETQFDLISRNGDWFIVDFKGPEVETPAPLPDALVIDATDTPETLVARFMDLVVTELGPSEEFGGATKLSVISRQVEDMWLDARESKRSLVQNLSMMVILQPKSWLLNESIITDDSAEIYVTFESDSPMAAMIPSSSGLRNTLSLRFTAQRNEGQWILISVVR